MNTRSVYWKDYSYYPLVCGLSHLLESFGSIWFADLWWTYSTIPGVSTEKLVALCLHLWEIVYRIVVLPSELDIYGYQELMDARPVLNSRQLD